MSPAQQYTLYGIIIAAAMLLAIMLSWESPTLWSYNLPKAIEIPAAKPPPITLDIPVAIVGAQSGVDKITGQRPSRLDFNVLRHSGPAFDLYLQCQKKFMDTDSNNTLSYEQIAQIHIRPYRAWNGAAGKVTFDNGYAMHKSVLFPVWHRPYLALYEQIISECAITLATEYPEHQRSTFIDAAISLRLPYWDWAVNHSIPTFFAETHCTVQTPTGKELISNPLHRYNFKPSMRADLDLALAGTQNPMYEFNHTVRCPDDNYVDRYELIHGLLDELDLKTRTFQLFSSLEGSYMNFSNVGISESEVDRQDVSLEMVHNVVHRALGGLIPHGRDINMTDKDLCGYMGGSLAAFDPIFWLHHANIDRIFALWQAVYPESYVTPRENYLGTYTQAPGTIESIQTPLIPFFGKDPKVPYNAITARYTRTFGYTYPELLDWTMSVEDLRKNVSNTLTALYG